MLVSFRALFVLLHLFQHLIKNGHPALDAGSRPNYKDPASSPGYIETYTKVNSEDIGPVNKVVVL